MKLICYIFICYFNVFSFHIKQPPNKNIYDLEQFTKTTTQKELITKFGSKNVKQDTVFFEEEYYEIGTKLFSGTKNEVSIIWKNKNTWSQPKNIFVTNPKSQWRFTNGVGITTTLKELEEINKSPFCFLGFGWGFAGTVIDWNKGVFDELFLKYKRVHIRLGPVAHHELLDKAFMGDKEINSSNMLMQKINPQVYLIQIDF